MLLHPTEFFRGRGPWYVAQSGLKLLIFLPQPPKGWDYRCTLPRLAPIDSWLGDVTCINLQHVNGNQSIPVARKRFIASSALPGPLKPLPSVISNCCSLSSDSRRRDTRSRLDLNPTKSSRSLLDHSHNQTTDHEKKFLGVVGVTVKAAAKKNR
jgi:hypothetical protein